MAFVPITKIAPPKVESIYSKIF